MSKIRKSPQHGTTNDAPDTPQSSSQPDGTAADAPRGETQARAPQQTESAGAEAESRRPHAENRTAAGKSSAPVNSQTSENRQSTINPSATTQSTEIDRATTKGSPLSDTFGEAGDPHGRGNLEIPDQTVDSNKSQQENFVGNPPTERTPSTEGAGDSRRKSEDEAA